MGNSTLFCCLDDRENKENTPKESQSIKENAINTHQKTLDDSILNSKFPENILPSESSFKNSCEGEVECEGAVECEDIMSTPVISTFPLKENSSTQKEEKFNSQANNIKFEYAYSDTINLPDKLWINLYIDNIEFTTKSLDDFGTRLKVYINVMIEDVGTEEIYCREDFSNLNRSNDDSLNNSRNLTDNSNFSNIQDNKAFQSYHREFPFERFVEFEVRKDQLNGLINISIYNNFYSKANNLLDIKIADCNLSSNELVKVLYLTNTRFNGMLELYDHKRETIGIMKIKMSISDRKLLNIDDNVDYQFKDTFNPPNESQICFINLDQNTLDKYYVNDQTTKYAFIKESFKFNSKIYKHPKSTDLVKYFISAIDSNNQFLLEAIFIALNHLMDSESEYDLVFKFLSNLGNDYVAKFYDLPKTTKFNFFFLEIYLKFINSYLLYHTNSKDISIFNRKFFQEEILILKLAEMVKNISTLTKKIYHKPGASLLASKGIELSILIAINLCKPIRTNFMKIHKSCNVSTIDLYINAYQNSLLVLQKRYSFLRPIESFLRHSNIINLLCKLFKHTVSIVCNDTAVELKNTEIQRVFKPKEMSDKIKVNNILYYSKYSSKTMIVHLSSH